MAKDPKQIIPMPELDSNDGAAQLVLSTQKSGRGLTSCAHIQFAGPNYIRFEMFGDFRTYPGAPVKASATQKNLDAVHAANFTSAVVNELLDKARAFYAAKGAKR
jgi:hypothetical protein